MRNLYRCDQVIFKGVATVQPVELTASNMSGLFHAQITQPSGDPGIQGCHYWDKYQYLSGSFHLWIRISNQPAKLVMQAREHELHSFQSKLTCGIGRKLISQISSARHLATALSSYKKEQ